MRLFLVELSRFRSRRAIVLVLLAAGVLTAVMVASTAWSTRPVTAADLAKAERTAQAEAQQPYVQRELRRCERNPERFMGPGGNAAECEEMIVPQPEWFLDRAALSLENQKEDTGIAVLMLVAAAAIVVGTTFAGGDWASGSMSNQLLFEPRRGTVWIAKAAAVTVGALLAATVVVAAFWVALYLVAASRDIETGATVQESIRAMAGRGILLAGAAALGAYGLTMLLRHTVGALALLFGYAVGGEALVAALPIERDGRFSLSNNVFAWVNNGIDVWDPDLPCDAGGGGMCEQTYRLTLENGATYLGVLLAAVLVLSVLLFRRRDIP